MGEIEIHQLNNGLVAIDVDDQPIDGNLYKLVAYFENHGIPLEYVTIEGLYGEPTTATWEPK